ncbi:MAG: DUF3037 domain-containing protein, partial [Candidatus Limnocylindrales bacterium]
MPGPRRSVFQYAVVRVVPRVERGECLNVGIVLLCRSRRYLGARMLLVEARLAAVAPGLDPATLRPHLSKDVATPAGPRQLALGVHIPANLGEPGAAVRMWANGRPNAA